MKLIKLKQFNSEEYTTYYGSKKIVEIPETFIEREEELRGIWFSTVANIDAPIMESIESYKAHLDDAIQTIKEYHFNTIVFQVRPSSDAFYESNLNPWSRFITGKEGKYPGFNVLEYVIQQAKKEGIRVHAWINPYRVSTQKLSEIEGQPSKEMYLNSLDDKNFAKQNMDCVIYTKEGKLILDPASQKVRDFVSDSVLEIAEKYDVKAVHIDDYFYPYDDILDYEEYKKFEASKENFTELADWRRNNVDVLIKQIHDKLATLDKKVEFGISPFGVHRNNSKFYTGDKKGGWEFGSNNHPSCFQGYEQLFADVFLWMEKGWIDYVVPQVYFDFNNIKDILENGKVIERREIVKYADLVDWWVWAAQKTNTKLYIGQGLYRYSDSGNWSNPEEIINQLKYNMKFDFISGSVFFTYKNLKETKVEALVKARELLLKTWTKELKDL